MHEAQLHKETQFITLTFDDEHLPIDESIHVKTFQKFMKAYRQHLSTTCFNITTGRNNKITLKQNKIRFYSCGEYGEDYNRAHYHAIIFGHEFKDKILWKQEDGINSYSSETLSQIWQNGFCSISDVTLASAQYVAKYIIPKQSGGTRHVLRIYVVSF